MSEPASPSSESTPARRRRNPIGPRDRRVITAVSIVAGAVGVLVASLVDGVSPTGATWSDSVLTGGLMAATTWAAATAPWWAIVVAGAMVAALAGSPGVLVVGVAVMLGGAAIGANVLNAAVFRSVAGAAAGLGVLGLDAPGPFGAESIAAAAVLALVIVSGTVRRPRNLRRTAIRTGAILGGAAVLFSAFVVFTGLAARSSLTDGDRLARRGLDALSEGDLATAQAAFESASNAFDRSAGTFGQIWTSPAALVPVVAQHRSAAIELSRGAAQATEDLARTVGALDLESVRVIDGRIDLDAVRALEPRLLELNSTVDELGLVIDGVSNPWLVDAIQSRLRSITVDIDERRVQGDVALEAVRIAPRMLGADRPMVYFVAFVTPAEVRGSIGFMGNFAELTADQGRITMTEIGRHTDLREGGVRITGDPPTWRIDGMDEFLARYGRRGFANRADGAASPQVWQIITASPHFPSTSEAIAQLYPQSGGRPIDGVIALDPEVIAALLEFTGPVVTADVVAELGEIGAIDDLPEQIDADNATRFLLLDQYVAFEDDNPDRIDALELLGVATVERLLDGALPGPTELGRVMGPLASSGHLAMWASDARAQSLFVELGVDHSLPELDGGDGVAVSLSNGSGNKIEVFLDVDAEYRRDIDPETGFLRGVLSVTLTNRAPAEGLPRYVIGNAVGLPNGWNRLLVGLYAPFPYNGATLDGEAIELTIDREQGWYVMGRTIDIPPGASRTIEMEFAGALDRFGDDLEPAIMVPNLASGAELTVTTTMTSGPVPSDVAG